MVGDGGDVNGNSVRGVSVIAVHGDTKDDSVSICVDRDGRCSHDIPDSFL